MYQNLNIIIHLTSFIFHETKTHKMKALGLQIMNQNPNISIHLTSYTYKIQLQIFHAGFKLCIRILATPYI